MNNETHIATVLDLLPNACDQIMCDGEIIVRAVYKNTADIYDANGAWVCSIQLRLLSPILGDMVDQLRSLVRAAESGRKRGYEQGRSSMQREMREIIGL